MAPCMPLAAPAVSCPARFHFMRLGRPLRAGLKAADAGKLDILHWNGCRRLQEAAQRERHARLIAEASVDKAGSGDKQVKGGGDGSGGLMGLGCERRRPGPGR